MNELQEFFNSVAVEQKKVAEEKARQEEQQKKLQPQVNVELSDLSEFFGVLGHAKRNIKPQSLADTFVPPKQEETQMHLELESFFNRLSSYFKIWHSLDEYGCERIFKKDFN